MYFHCVNLLPLLMASTLLSTLHAKLFAWIVLVTLLIGNNQEGRLMIIIFLAVCEEGSLTVYFWDLA